MNDNPFALKLLQGKQAAKDFRRYCLSFNGSVVNDVPQEFAITEVDSGDSSSVYAPFKAFLGSAGYIDPDNYVSISRGFARMKGMFLVFASMPSTILSNA